MPNDSGSYPIYYHKLVRDKIPSIIRDNDHQPTVSSLSGQDLTQAANQKLLEEAYELFTEAQTGNKASVLNESADVLEVVLTILKQLGYSFDDLVSEMKRRREYRGGFEQGFFLESVDGHCLGSDWSRAQVLCAPIWIPILYWNFSEEKWKEVTKPGLRQPFTPRQLPIF
jgi:phosphoribosyl-ATP pyrophosphohydrolase